MHQQYIARRNMAGVHRAAAGAAGLMADDGLEASSLATLLRGFADKGISLLALGGHGIDTGAGQLLFSVDEARNAEVEALLDQHGWTHEARTATYSPIEGMEDVVAFVHELETQGKQVDSMVVTPLVADPHDDGDHIASPTPGRFVQVVTVPGA